MYFNDQQLVVALNKLVVFKSNKFLHGGMAYRKEDSAYRVFALFTQETARHRNDPNVYTVRYRLYTCPICRKRSDDIKCIKCTKAFKQYCGHCKIVYASSGGLGGHLRYVTDKKTFKLQ